MKVLVIIFLVIISFSVSISARDNLEGLSFGVDGGILYAPNAKKFSVTSKYFYPDKIHLSATHFITLGAYGRYGITDEFGFEFGMSKSFTGDIKIVLYRYEFIYMITPYRENRYYVKFGGVRNQTESNVYESAGSFNYSNGLIYTAGVELGYSKMPLNISISYLNLKSKFFEEDGWARTRANYDLSGLMIKSSFNIKL